jgi:transposase
MPFETKERVGPPSLNGILWVMSTGAPWRDLPSHFGPYTTCYNRFVRWRRAGVWDRVLDALTDPDASDVQMIDSSVVRVHQHGASIRRDARHCMGDHAADSRRRST